jgi:hypothetical protein
MSLHTDEFLFNMVVRFDEREHDGRHFATKCMKRIVVSAISVIDLGDGWCTLFEGKAHGE